MLSDLRKLGFYRTIICRTSVGVRSVAHWLMHDSTPAIISLSTSSDGAIRNNISGSFTTTSSSVRFASNPLHRHRSTGQVPAPVFQ